MSGISKTREKILEALIGGEKVYVDDLKKITAAFKADIFALKKEGGLGIKLFQNTDDGRMFYVLEAAAEGAVSPPTVARSATAPPPATQKPAAPTSGASPSRVTVNVALFTAKILPKSGRMKFEGYVEGKGEALVLSSFLLDNPDGEFIISLRKPGYGDYPELGGEDVEPQEETAIAVEAGVLEAGVLEEAPPEPTPTTEVPLYDSGGTLIGYRQVSVPDAADDKDSAEKTAAQIREEVKSTGLSPSAESGMEDLLDRSADGPVDPTI
jgi:hypothetical protein